MVRIIVLIIVLVIVLLIVVSSIKIVSPGPCHGRGTSWRVSDHMARGAALQDSVSGSGGQKCQPEGTGVDFPPQPVITKDNVTMQIDTVVYYQITDPKLSLLRRGESDHGYRESDGHHAAK